LTKKHRKLMKQGEVFLAACDAFGAGEPHPAPLGSSRRQPTVAVSSPNDVLLQNAAARDRLAWVQAALGMHDEDFAELPVSDNGYLLAHTDRRMLIFDGTGNHYQLQAPMKGLWLQPVKHGNGEYTLVFNNSEERVAVATRRESIELTRDFIRSFPDRRGQDRTLNLKSHDRSIEF